MIFELAVELLTMALRAEHAARTRAVEAERLLAKVKLKMGNQATALTQQISEIRACKGVIQDLANRLGMAHQEVAVLLDEHRGKADPLFGLQERLVARADSLYCLLCEQKEDLQRSEEGGKRDRVSYWHDEKECPLWRDHEILRLQQHNSQLMRSLYAQQPESQKIQPEPASSVK